ncbi:hypothetical protein KQX54_000820 [Cotesia glomerata]|uniref:SLC41A/MgtE integral membrane domain-containing protein n=1 Tax=Cotesia glomerata TaxID=32391 RepID=A0AAV7ITL1_COTGL|nr:hypothetical protein KQX54_000820 [Cotesia glomerata]
MGSLPLYRSIDNQPWIANHYDCSLFISDARLGIYCCQESFLPKKFFNYGWSPVISAMLISSIGGLMLNFTISNYKGIAVFQLVINGVGENLIAVQESRISTSLHLEQHNGKVEKPLKICISPIDEFSSPVTYIFSYTISYLRAGQTSFTATFIVVYLLATLLQVILLLYLAQLMVVWMWSRGMDPDSSAIPYLTAAGDLLGTPLLGIAFKFFTKLVIKIQISEINRQVTSLIFSP